MLMRPFIIFLLLILSSIAAHSQKPFDFFALGDMPYHNPEDIGKFKKLTDLINQEKPAFTVHVGDIKNGSTPCSDDYFRMMLDMLNRFQAPLLYTPGDNEWTDCGRPAAGGFDATERLHALRTLYFRNGQSLGAKPMKLTSQHEMQGFEEFVENVLWRKESITFATVHVVGSNNNYKPNGADNSEFLKRDSANIRWLSNVFQTAQANNDAAVVIVMHAAMSYLSTDKNGFTNILDKLRKEVKAFHRPVLLIYGDHHRFEISKPLMDNEKNLIQNFTALMVFGDTEMNAVKIHVDPRSREIFSFSEFVMDYK
jgi:hypothetical protein